MVEKFYVFQKCRGSNNLDPDQSLKFEFVNPICIDPLEPLLP